MIDLEFENPIPLKDATADPRLRRNGKPVNFSSVWRWAKFGARGADGSRIRLETVRRPAGLVTTAAAIGRFIERLTGEAQALPATPREIERRSKRASAELEKWFGPAASR